jgi:hypothetical protein
LAKTGFETLVLRNCGAVKLLSDCGFDALEAAPKVATMAVTPTEAEGVAAFLLKSNAGAPPLADDNRRALGFTVDALDGEADRGP